MFDSLRVPVIAAPMAGGPSTPELVAATARVGAFGFLAGGYLNAAALADQIAHTRRLSDEKFGVNLFVPGIRSTVDLSPYTARLRAEGGRYGVEPGDPRWDDDGYSAKLDLLVEARVPVVSFTFGVPLESDVERLHEAGSTIVVTVTSPDEAREAVAVGADALCVQGFEAGGHRGIFTDDPRDPFGGEVHGVLAALRLVAGVTDLPVIASGGIVHGADVAAVLSAGAVAAQLGTAFLRADEAGTHHPAARARGGDTLHGRDAGVQRAARARSGQPVPARAHAARARRLPAVAPAQ